MGLHEFLRRLDPELPMILVAAAIAGVVLEAFRPTRERKGFRPPAAFWPVAAVAVFVFPLIVAWSRAISDGSTLFGIFPWSDAGAYYQGAEHLLETGKLPPWNCRRPLATVTLAVLLKATGQNIQAVQLLQAVLMGLSAFALSRTIGRDLGWPGGLLVFAILFAFGRKCVFWLLSEWLGLTMGALALSLLWRGSRSGRKATLWWGTAMLTLALNARAGTFLVLPSLVLWSGFAFREKRFFHWGAAASITAGILFGFLVNGSIMKIYGNRFGVGHGNFSMTLYGLASGEPGWSRIYRDFPETLRMPEDSLNEFAYRKSREWIARDPFLLAESLLRASKEALSRFPDLPGLDRSLTRPRIAKWFLAPLVMASALVFLWRFRRRPEVTMVAASLAGFLLSVPVLWTDGGERAYVATLPVLAVFLSSGISGWRRRADHPLADSAAPGSSPRTWPLAVAGAALVAVAAVGPALAIRVTKAPQMFSLPDPAVGDSAVIRSDAPRIDVLSPRDPQTTFVPRVARIDYLHNLPSFAMEDFRRLPRPGVVFFARSLLSPIIPGLSDRYIWVLGPANLVQEKPRFLLLQGSYRRETGVFHVSGFSVLGKGAD